MSTGEIVVGPCKTLFMDEISTGLDSSTTYQIVRCIRNMVHLRKVRRFLSSVMDCQDLTSACLPLSLPFDSICGYFQSKKCWSLVLAEHGVHESATTAA